MISYFFGFSLWKQKNIESFFSKLIDGNIIFVKDLNDALQKGLMRGDQIYIWGKKVFDGLDVWAKENSVQVYRVEDGFIRSVSLGSDLTKAYSLVVDSRGIYFDPTTQSDLEYIFQNYNFDEEILQRAKSLQQYLIDKKISKYNIHQDKEVTFDTDKKIVLVIGQVEDDASIIYGGDGMNNLKLLQKVYEKRKDEYIIYKPHPDVLVRNRKGNIQKDIVLEYANEQIDNISLPSLLDVCDEVHTITSLSGFEGLIRGKKVYTYGMPFYAGWGLSIDNKACERRERLLSIEELIAGTYILYPRYMSPKNGNLCEIEDLINSLELMKKRYNSKLYKYIINIRNIISRLGLLIVRILKD